MEAKIIFNDGTELNVEVNGGAFITATEPEFPEDLSRVVIEEDENETVLTNVSVQPCASVDGRFWFTFIKPTIFEKLESQVMYTALITDTLLEEMEEE